MESFSCLFLGCGLTWQSNDKPRTHSTRLRDALLHHPAVNRNPHHRNLQFPEQIKTQPNPTNKMKKTNTSTLIEKMKLSLSGAAIYEALTVNPTADIVRDILETGLDQHPLRDLLKPHDITTLAKKIERVRRMAEQHTAAQQAEAERSLHRSLYRALHRNRTLAALFKSKLMTFRSVMDYLQTQLGQTTITASIFHPDNYTHRRSRQNVGKAVSTFIQTLPIMKKTQPKTLAEKLPLYACSGELEANGLDYTRRAIRNFRREYWHCGQDGGGQHEIRFAITPKVTAAACGLVTELGPASRNGGHIHLNCAKNEEIGRRVFLTMREQLSWFRFLTVSARRRGRWSSVDAVPETFRVAQGVKAAAISCNTWRITGTVEVRVWGSTDKPEQWAYRAALMQEIARMSETQCGQEGSDFTSATARIAQWEKFYLWTITHNPELLRATLTELRKMTRQSRDQIAADRCAHMLSQFDMSGLRLQGYRRRRTATPTAPAAPTVTL